LEPLRLTAVNVTVRVEPAQTGFGETPVTVIDCACAPTEKNERRKREKSERKILRTGKPITGVHRRAAVIFLKIEFIQINNLYKANVRVAFTWI
jgi:hypothetical protein